MNSTPTLYGPAVNGVGLESHRAACADRLLSRNRWSLIILTTRHQEDSGWQPSTRSSPSKLESRLGRSKVDGTGWNRY